MVGFRLNLMHKDEIELCMKQAEYFARRWDGRRNFEWRMSLAIWAILAAGIRFLPELHNFRWWLPLVPVLLHSLWVYGIWKANWIDKEQGRYFQDHAQKFLMHPGQPVHWDHLPDKVPGPTRLKRVWMFLNDWSMQFQLLTTTVLAAALVWFSQTQTAK